MRNKILAFLLLAVMLVGCGCSKSKEVKITGEDTQVTSRLENIVELQKSLVKATVNSVETVDAVITKYNIDISKYTVYNVTIEESFDGYTPTGSARFYWIGTEDEYKTRVGLEKNETYILDAEPWVYGDEVVYLLAPFTVSYPKVDIANAVTIALSADEALSAGNLDTYREEYNKAVAAVDTRIPGFSGIDQAAKRYADIFKTVLDKNSDRGFYTSDERVFEWVPSDEQITATVNRSQAVYDKASALVGKDVTKEQITELFK